MDRFSRADQERMAFSPDGKSLLATVVNKDRYNDEHDRPEAAWTVGSWGLVDGHKQFVLTGLLLGSGMLKSVKLSPDGEWTATLVGNRLQVWDVPRLARLRAELDAGDRFWSAEDHPKAFDHYCSVLADNMAWFVQDDLPRVYSRCVDTFAERGEVAKGRLLVARTQRSKLALSPETLQGKKLVFDLETEQAEARRVESERRIKAEADRLAGVRAKNRSMRVAAGSLTKREFIDKLKQVMYQGRIDDLATHAIFEDHSFEDVFGEPARNIEWVDHRRLVSYPCRDGVLVLTVMYLGPRTILQGIDQL
jgi:hypothetical protein